MSYVRAGAPLGIAHGHATVEFAVIEKIREDRKKGDAIKVLAKKYDISANTISDWVYYRSRILK